MRLTHIRVEGCGRFVDPVTVMDFAPGLNVLCAPNESGKSTLFEAVRACLFEKHTSKNETLRKLASETASKPLSIEVGFEHGGHAYVARKTFLSSARATLTCDGREIAGGGHADEKLHELLGLRTAGRAVDEGAFGLLWVRQTNSFEQAEVKDAAREGLESAIEREVGTLVGGERARETLKTIEAELATAFTPTGQVRKGGPLGLAEDRARAAADELAAAQGLLAELENDLDLLERKRRERVRLGDPATIAEMREKLEEARRERAAGDDAAREIDRLAQHEKLAALARDEAARILEDLRACARSLDEAMEARAELSGAISADESRREELVRELEAARARLSDIEAGESGDERQEAHLRRLATVVAAAARLPELEARAAALDAAENERRLLRQSLAPLRASARHTQALDKIAQERAVLEARLEAAATRVALTLEPGASGVTVDGRAVAGPVSFPATRRTVIAIAGIGEVAIEPPAQLDVEARAKLAELDSKVARVLADAGLADERSVREQAARRADLEARLAGLGARVLALGSSDEGLAGDLAALQAQMEGVRAQVSAELGAGEVAPDAAAISARQDALSEQRRAKGVERAALNASIAAHTKSLLEVGARASEHRARAEALARQIEAGLARLPPVERASRLAEAGEAFDRRHDAHRSAALALEQAQTRAPGPERLEKLRDRVARLELAMANHTDALHALDQEIAGIGGRIQSRGGEGLGERVAGLGEEQEVARREAQRLRARADALILLKETILGCYEEQRDRLQTPLRRRLQPFLDDVFPRAEITLDERFAVERIVRAGAAERFERLSAGAQEQIAILVRLAMGTLLRERGEDVPIILDDALVFSDDERIEHMFDALNRAARTQQVIVLTCRSASFRSLGGKTLTIEAATPTR
jgi:uncharacterized protein YhaN